MKKSLRFALCALFVLYVIFTLRMTFFGAREGAGYPFKDYFLMRSNLIPLRTVKSYIRAIRLHTPYFKTAVKNIIGNTVLFMPLPIFLALFFPKFRKFFPSITLVFLIILVVEALQLLTRRGSFDVDDLLLNTIGAVIGRLCLPNPLFSGRHRLPDPPPRRHASLEPPAVRKSFFQKLFGSDKQES